MREQDRKQLETLHISPEAIAKADEVLQFWGIEVLFVECSLCGNPCYNPELPGRHRRKKLPAELFFNRDLLSCKDKQTHYEVRCMACDDAIFQ